MFCIDFYFDLDFYYSNSISVSRNVKTVGGRESTETEGGQIGELHPSETIIFYVEIVSRFIFSYGSGELLETDPRKLTVE